MTETEEKGETGREGRHQSEVFYANYGMVVSLNPAWLQGAFSALVAIFNRVGHADCLTDISPQAYPVEDGYQGAESALEPGGV